MTVTFQLFDFESMENFQLMLLVALLAVYISPQKPHNMKKTACLFMESHFLVCKQKVYSKFSLLSNKLEQKRRENNKNGPWYETYPHLAVNDS